MPRMSQEVTTTQTTEVLLAPKLKQALQTRLLQYAKLQKELKAIEARMETLKAEMGDLRDEAGEMSIALEGYGTVTLVCPTYKKFNPKLFVANGGELATYNQSVEEKPKSPYNKITLPGQRESSGGGDE